MTYQTADARKEFDSWSRHYDRSLLQSFFFQPAHRMLIDYLQPSDRRILDIGSGTGVFAERVLARHSETQVWGLDLSAGMLGRCCMRAQVPGDRLHLVQGDSQRLPFQDNAFDVVTCTHSFHHYPRQELVVAEMCRVLRPGGRLFIIDGDRDRWWGQLFFDVLVVLLEGPVRHLTSQALRELYRDAGFANISQRRRGGPLPFLLTTGQAAKTSRVVRSRQAARFAFAGQAVGRTDSDSMLGE